MSSDLSFLIQNGNEVQVDESFLEKYQKLPTKVQKPQTKSNDSRDPPKKQIKLKKKMTQIQGSKKKKFPVKSYTSEHFPEFENDKSPKKILNPENSKSPHSFSPFAAQQNSKYLELIEKRIGQIVGNQKTIEEEISSKLFDIKYVIQSNEQTDKNLVNLMDKTKHEVKKTQKGIGQILALIQRHSEMNNRKGSQQWAY